MATHFQKPHDLNRAQKRALELGVDLDRLPKHIALIMDGNGRWAQKKGFQRLLGHREGYRTLRKVLMDASELGIKYLTVYTFSAENWKRPEEEVNGLMQLIETAARDELRSMHQNNVRIRTTGRLHEVPKGLQEALEKGIELTKNNTGITFILAINYGGRAEIVDAVKDIFNHHYTSAEITEELISQHLYNPDVPDPDLFIRTSGVMRSSNYLMWQAAYTEFYFTETHWPDFNFMELIKGIQFFQKTLRNFGGLITPEETRI